MSCHNSNSGSTLAQKGNENLRLLNVEMSEAASGTVFPYTIQFSMCVGVQMCLPLNFKMPLTHQSEEVECFNNICVF
jgi:hypothetical protein